MIIFVNFPIINPCTRTSNTDWYATRYPFVVALRLYCKNANWEKVELKVKEA